MSASTKALEESPVAVGAEVYQGREIANREGFPDSVRRRLAHFEDNRVSRSTNDRPRERQKDNSSGRWLEAGHFGWSGPLVCQMVREDSRPQRSSIGPRSACDRGDLMSRVQFDCESPLHWADRGSESSGQDLGRGSVDLIAVK